MDQERNLKGKNIEKIRDCLIYLYGVTIGKDAFAEIQKLLGNYRGSLSSQSNKNKINLSQRDAILITYGDQLTEPSLSPLNTLGNFCHSYLDGLVSGVHILPFFPSTSDDGFSVTDFKKVNPNLGSWKDIATIGKHFRLMFDAVINHVSSQSAWFQAFLKDDPQFRNYFIVVNDGVDLSQVVRPRALPLLTSFITPSGGKSVWTTFSSDQVDLNYHNPAVLLEIIDTILFYVSQGAEFIRLDAIAYLWKEIGTYCIHLPQTHRVIQLFRTVLDIVAPKVLLITETNVPHIENISYFGDSTNEAQLVYNFALPPLVLYTMRCGDASVLSKWAAGLELPSNRVSFFNFLASHDGIGLNPVRGILSDRGIEKLVEGTLMRGGLVSYKNNSDGTKSPYELNINYFDALSNLQDGELEHLQIDRFMASQAIMLSHVGVPGIYFHSMFGSSGWPEGVSLSGQNRTINRQKLDLVTLKSELHDFTSRRYKVYSLYAQILRARACSTAFHPLGNQLVMDFGNAIFALLRSSPDGYSQVLCLHNVSDNSQFISLEHKELFKWVSEELVDLITGNKLKINPKTGLRLEPYQIFWLTGKQNDNGRKHD